MSLKAGRVGVNPADVDPVNGHINPDSVDIYTKAQADAKFATLEDLADDVKDVYQVMGNSGAKNKIPMPYKTASGTIVRGVTISYDNTGVITFSGQNDNTSDSEFDLVASADNFCLPVGHYILSGGNSLTTKIFVLYDDTYYNSRPNPVDINITDATKPIRITAVVGKGTTPTGKLYPMLRDARDTDPTYQPPCLTNAELTLKNFNKDLVLSSTDDLNSITETGIYGISTSPANAPESIAYCTLIVQKSSSDSIRQMIFKQSVLYLRNYGGSPAAWQSWYKFSGSIVS